MTPPKSKDVPWLAALSLLAAVGIIGGIIIGWRGLVYWGVKQAITESKEARNPQSRLPHRGGFVRS